MIKTRIAGFELKKADLSDASLVYELILELAAYEGAKKDVRGTLEQLKENIWEKNRAQVFLLYFKENPIGFCLICPVFSTFLCNSYLYLDDLFIKEEYRGYGYGKEMFYQLAKITKQDEHSQLEWFCFDDNTNGQLFYENAIKAKRRDNLIRYALDAQGIEDILNK